VKRLTFLLLAACTGLAHATDYNFGRAPVVSPSSHWYGWNSQALPGSWSDTASVTFGDWVEPDGSIYQYSNMTTVVVHGEFQRTACSGRGCVPPTRHTTIPQAVLYANDGQGTLTVPVDVTGTPVQFSYTPYNSTLGKVDEWQLTAALPAGEYTVVMDGTSCSGRNCAIAGGSYWFMTVNPQYTYIPAPPPPPPPPGED